MPPTSLVVLLLVAAAASIAADDTGRKSLVARRLISRDEHAVCNDGSTALYYANEKDASSATRWVIRLMGGGWCISSEDCDARHKSQPYLMTSKSLPDTLSVGMHLGGIPDAYLPFYGILSANTDDNPYFGDWRHIYLWYCSSDSHLGDAPAGTQDTGRWQFRGKRIVAAMIEDLLESEGLDEAEQILVTGDSAGGVGIMNNADCILERIRNEAKSLKSYKVLVDAGWFLDLPNFSDPAGFTFQAAAKHLKDKWNASYDRQCEEHFGPADAWHCFHAQYAWPHIPVPTLYIENLYDTANLAYDSARTSEDRESFRKQLEDSIAPKSSGASDSSSELPTRVNSWLYSSSAPASGFQERGSGALSAEAPNIFAAACQLHETIDSASFWKLEANGQQLGSVLTKWYERGTGVSAVDTHQGARGGDACLGASSTFTSSG